MNSGRELPAWWGSLLGRIAGGIPRNGPPPSLAPADARSSAVLILLGERGSLGPDVLLLRRADGLRNHAGQVAFPGGASEPGDADLAATALREANEEVGLDPTSVTIVATLPAFWIPVSNYLVTPVLAWWHEEHDVAPVDLGEVARVDRLTLAELAEPTHRFQIRYPDGRVGPAFVVGDVMVWGFTGGMLSSLLDAGGWARAWATDDITEYEALRAGLRG